jgi:hypothetical protein
MIFGFSMVELVRINVSFVPKLKKIFSTLTPSSGQTISSIGSSHISLESVLHKLSFDVKISRLPVDPKKTNFFLTEALIELQTQGLKLSKQLEILGAVKDQLQGNCLVKLEKSLRKNPDLKKFIKDDNDYEFRCNIKFAPLVSVDVERSFSKYKEILSDKRQNMTKATVEHLNIICFNNFLN